MYKKIMVAVDASDTAKQAMQEAISLAKQLQATLRIVHIADEQFVDYSGIGIDYVAYNAAIKDSGVKILSEMEKIAKSNDVECDTQLIELKILDGRIEQKIIDAVKAWPADLLVLGTHGYRGITHFLLGSVAEGIVRISPVPVLLIRGTAGGKK